LSIFGYCVFFIKIGIDINYALGQGDIMMDQITTAIVATNTANKVGIGGKIYVDAYKELKSAIQSRFGQNNQLSEAITNIEIEPDSKRQQIILFERVTGIKADQDEEILAAAEYLINRLKKIPGGKSYILDAQDNLFLPKLPLCMSAV
jgi:hypothetical protein